MPLSDQHRMSQHTLKPFLETANLLADEAGAVIRPFFRRPIRVENKAGKDSFDPVTAADKAAERIIRKQLARLHPDHGILGEEYGHTTGQTPFTWVIDPIDGTKAFITGSPLWGTLIGLQYQADAVLGMMDQPFTGERVWAAGGASQWLQPDGKVRRIKTRRCTILDEAILATTSPDLMTSNELAAFLSLKAKARLTRYGGDCYAYCLLAAGHIDLVVECGLKPHDVVALIPIIEQAGGRITTWDGKRAISGGRIVAAGDPTLHSIVLAHIARTFKG